MDQNKVGEAEKKKGPKNIFVQGAISPAFIAEGIAKHATQTNIGAHNIFLGQVRSDVLNGREVKAIDYTSYEEMALEKMHEIREAIFEQYQLTCMHVYHSLGRVAAGQLCLFVFTSAKHRQTAIEACQQLVERIKAELPVWGKELFDDETFEWKKPANEVDTNSTTAG